MSSRMPIFTACAESVKICHDSSQFVTFLKIGLSPWESKAHRGFVTFVTFKKANFFISLFFYTPLFFLEKEKDK